MEGRFNIIMFINANELDYSCASNRNSMPFILSLAKNMKDTGKVLVVTHYIPLLLAPILHPIEFIRYLIGSSINKVTDNLYVYTPSIPLNLTLAEKLPFMLRLCQKYFKYFLRKKLQSLGFSSDIPRIMFVTHPFHIYYVGLAEEDLIVYKCCDDFARMNQNEPDQHILELEGRLAVASDVVLATAQTLFERLKAKSCTYYFPNAVDFELFNQTRLSRTPVASELLDIPKPIIGFVGNLSSWYDFALLHEIISKRVEWSFVFVGEIAQNVRKIVKSLETLPNTFFLGWKDYYSLPSFLKGIDVVIMPYKNNEFMQSVDPCKMYQFMAAGLPIVSTPIPQILKFKNVIMIAEDAESFIKAIERSISSHNCLKLAEQITLARKESWDERAKVALRLIQEKLDTKL